MFAKDIEVGQEIITNWGPAMKVVRVRTWFERVYVTFNDGFVDQPTVMYLDTATVTQKGYMLVKDLVKGMTIETNNGPQKVADIFPSVDYWGRYVITWEVTGEVTYAGWDTEVKPV